MVTTMFSASNGMALYERYSERFTAAEWLATGRLPHHSPYGGPLAGRSAVMPCGTQLTIRRRAPLYFHETISRAIYQA